jgi:hypothetical protein
MRLYMPINFVCVAAFCLPTVDRYQYDINCFFFNVTVAIPAYDLLTCLKSWICGSCGFFQDELK